MAHCFLSVKSKLKCKLGYFDLIGCDFLIDENFKVLLRRPGVGWGGRGPACSCRRQGPSVHTLTTQAGPWSRQLCTLPSPGGGVSTRLRSSCSWGSPQGQTLRPSES